MRPRRDPLEVITKLTAIADVEARIEAYAVKPDADVAELERLELLRAARLLSLKCWYSIEADNLEKDIASRSHRLAADSNLRAFYHEKRSTNSEKHNVGQAGRDTREALHAAL